MYFIKIFGDIYLDIYIRFILYLINIFPGSTNNKISNSIKKLLLNFLKIKIGVNGQISRGLYISNYSNVKFGNNCKIGANLKIWNFSPLNVGNNLLSSHNITVICATHDTSDERNNIPGPIFIGNNVWIGANVLIVGPANIGDNAIIGANSYVTGIILPNKKYGGSPAKLLN
jgi:maltose O-acetyltransferase